MTTYAIGDIQGCFGAFQALLDKVAFNPAKDCLWSVGDLVNRGPDNLSTLRWFHAHQDCVRVVLGNHDLHLLAAAAGAKKLGKSDNLEDVLEAPDRQVLLEWLAQQPLLYREGNTILTHAGLPPDWSADDAERYAAEVSAVLRSNSAAHFYHHMYGNEPRRLSPQLRGMARLRAITNSLTRMRFCTPSGWLDFKHKGAPQALDATLNGEPLNPWFEQRQPDGVRVIFGHWASLDGQTHRDDLEGLDTGCVWGGALTLLDINSGQRWQHRCGPTAP